MTKKKERLGREIKKHAKPNKAVAMATRVRAERKAEAAEEAKKKEKETRAAITRAVNAVAQYDAPRWQLFSLLSALIDFRERARNTLGIDIPYLMKKGARPEQLTNREQFEQVLSTVFSELEGKPLSRLVTEYPTELKPYQLDKFIALRRAAGRRSDLALASRLRTRRNVRRLRQELWGNAPTLSNRVRS